MKTLQFHIDVVSSAAAIYSGLVQSVTVPTLQGEIAIYARHAPLLAICRAGQLKLEYQTAEQEFLYIDGGMLEVHPKGVTLLADTAIRARDIDEASAEKVKQAALRTIAQHDENCDCAQSYAELLNSLAMLKTLHNCRRQSPSR